jgi:hypothetical protein
MDPPMVSRDGRTTTRKEIDAVINPAYGVKGFLSPPGPDEICASPPHYSRGLGGRVAKQGLEKLV